MSKGISFYLSTEEVGEGWGVWEDGEGWEDGAERVRKQLFLLPPTLPTLPIPLPLY